MTATALSTPAPERWTAPPALDPAQLAELAEGRRRLDKVRRAAGVARLSGWSIGVFAILTLAFGAFGDPSSLALGAVMGFCAWRELRAAGRLERLDAGAPAALAWGQIALGAAIVAYSGWSLWSALRASALAGQTTGDPKIDAMVERLSALAGVAVYGSMAVVGALGCGLAALWWFTRARVVRDAVRSTPAWVLRAHGA